MLLAFDAHYSDTSTRLIAASFTDWTASEPLAMHRWDGEAAAAYEPGQFYKRELPLILKALNDFELDGLTTIIIDGYVYLNEAGRLGLGGHLYQALDERIPVVGIAKSYFRDTNAERVLRGESRKPLFVTACGMPPNLAAEHVRSMAGPYRMPDILALVDRGTKD